MKDSTLLLTALATGTLGLAALFFLFQSARVPEYDLGTVKGMANHEDVRALAVVQEATRYGNLTFLTLQKTEVVEAVVFAPINLTRGETIEVTGKVGEYEGEKQIVVEKISVVG